MRERMYRILGILLGLLLCVALLPTSAQAATDEVRYQQTQNGLQEAFQKLVIMFMKEGS